MNQRPNQSTTGLSPARALLLTLYERKDTKRRRFLYHYYRNFFEEPYSVGYLVEIINRDLGKALVTARDIKYIRANVYKWKQEGEILSTKSQTDQRDGQSNPS